MSDSGTVALVTGATGTVGGAVARRLAGEGLRVVVHGVRPAAVAGLVEELGADRATPLVADLTDRTAVASALAAVRREGVEIDVLVNAAGEFGPIARVVDVPAEHWRRVIDLDLGSLLSLIQLTVPGMIERGYGLVIQVGSAAGRAAPGPGNAPYSVAKAAADRLLAHLASEVAGTGVTVHSLHPGEIDSRMRERIAAAAAQSPELGGFAAWAAATETAPDDPDRVGDLVTALLDPETAAALHGDFLFAQRVGWDPRPLA